MQKDFDKWNKKKKIIAEKDIPIKFQERHIVFMHIGCNVGYEQDGKGSEFLRPVLVYKKFNNHIFLGIPLTSKAKENKFHYKFEYKKNKKSYAILSQLKLFDIKRAKYYDGKISKKFFFELQEKLLKLIVTPLQKEGECTKAICKYSISKIQEKVKMQKDSKIYIAGHRGLVGSAILENLKQKGYSNFVLKTHSELDLTNQSAVEEFFKKERPEYVFLAAAKVGGIVANNTYRAEFIYENLTIQNNIIHNAYKYGVKKLMFLGSTCIYPKNAPQPLKENYLLTSELEYTNEPYAIAKIAGIKMCESYNLQYGTNFISVMPTNLYGKNDNFDLERSHVLPALIRKVHLAKALQEKNWEEIQKDLNKNPIEGISGDSSKENIVNILKKYGVTNNQVEIWGSGKPKREFLYSEDMADACVFLMENVDFTDILKEQININSTCDITEYKTKEIRNTHINIGTGKDITIKELAYLIKEVVGYNSEFYFNTTKPDGTMKKLTDVTKLNNLGWKYKVELEEGINKVYGWYRH